MVQQLSIRDAVKHKYSIFLSIDSGQLNGNELYSNLFLLVMRDKVCGQKVNSQTTPCHVYINIFERYKKNDSTFRWISPINIGKSQSPSLFLVGVELVFIVVVVSVVVVVFGGADSSKARLLSRAICAFSSALNSLEMLNI